MNPSFNEHYPLLINLAYQLRRPTGTTTYALNLLPDLNSLHPLVLTAQNSADYPCYPIPANLTPEQGLRGHGRRLLWNDLQLPQIYRQFQSQLIFTPIPEAPVFTQCRSVVTVHDLIPLRFAKRFSPLTHYCRYYVPYVLRHAEHILCNSQATANDIVQFFQIPSSKITPTLLAYDASHFQYLDLPQRHYFLYLGRREPYKNLHRLIAAFATLPSREYELWIAGPADPRYTPVLVAQAEDLGITAQVKFLDYVPYADLPVLMNQAIALVFPSLWEGFGLPVLEAMACGTPVITSNLSSLPEVTGDAALLIDPYRVEAIASAMHEVAVDLGVRSQLRQAGLLRARQFSWRKTGQATVEILQKYL